MPDSISYVAPYTPREEFANAGVHTVGFLVAVAALVYMASVMPARLSAWQQTGVFVYGISLSLMFLTSILYHAVAHPGAKQVLKRLDHSAIYLLIAGSYTPILTILVQSFSATIILTVLWIVAVVGIVLKAFFGGRFRWLSVSTYLVLGWLPVVEIYRVYQILPTTGFALLLAGGIAYTVGVIFYINKRIPFNHAIWHCFVFVGAMCHCWLIAEYVLFSGQVS